ncbi:hypothetical protein ACQKHV_12730, partial [Staphylococcus hominis]|uniref:hypothetical protein n=1 Tax=Staphylococcus hominis TaxID=1290 RepID=UPI003D055277
MSGADAGLRDDRAHRRHVALAARHPLPDRALATSVRHTNGSMVSTAAAWFCTGPGEKNTTGCGRAAALSPVCVLGKLTPSSETFKAAAVLTIDPFVWRTL